MGALTDNELVLLAREIHDDCAFADEDCAVDRLRTLMAEARAEALEEAGMRALEVAAEMHGMVTAQALLAAIRALKQEPAP